MKYLFPGRKEGRKARQSEPVRRGHCFPSINSTVESNEALVVVVVVVCTQLEGSRRYRNANMIVKALTRHYTQIECSVLM